MMLENQKMAISRDHVLGLCGDRRFQNPIVGFVFKNVEDGSGTYTVKSRKCTGSLS